MGSGAGDDRNGQRRRTRLGRCRVGWRQRNCAGRSDERDLGHAGFGDRGRSFLSGAGSRSDRAGHRATVPGGPPMTPNDYDYLRDLLKARSGLVLGADKHYLVESRLLPVVRKVGLIDLAALVQKLKGAESESLATEVVEAMTTNETFFFRDRIPFDHFRETVVPSLLERRAATRRIRIWCAAASTGQEPYTLAICLKEMGKQLAGWQVEIVGTDISNEALEKARSGIYSQFEVQRGLPILMLVKYFAQVGELWQVTPEL